MDRPRDTGSPGHQFRRAIARLAQIDQLREHLRAAIRRQLAGIRGDRKGG
jgi:hypothetical protein